MSAAFLQIEKRDLPTVALQKARLVSLDQHIVVVKMPDQQRGMYVVLAHILPHRRLRFVGVAILAEVRAGIIPAYVSAFDAKAAAPQSVMFYVAEDAAVCLAERL